MDYSAISLAALEKRWPCAWGGTVGEGTIRHCPDDFFVVELPLVTPAGEGEHLWLWVEKSGANTAWVAGQLARQAGIQGRDVSFAGRKDRHARTQQYFSLHMPGSADPDWQNWHIDGVTILAGTRHLKKLRRGALAGNRFKLLIRNISADSATLDPLLSQIAASGVPNYFGPQRFGRDGANIKKAALLLTGGKRYPRNLRNILLSAARSLIFNEVLAARISGQSWDSLIPGDIVQLAGSQSVFAVAEPDAELLQRCEDFDITPTGPLAGETSKREAGPPDAEEGVLKDHACWVECLCSMRMAEIRRPLRLRVNKLQWAHDEEGLQLNFELGAGAYATAVLRELLDCGEDSATGAGNRE